MTLQNYLIGMGISTLICFVTWLGILVYIDPIKSGILGLILFLTTLFFTLTGFFALIIFFLQRKFRKDKIIFSHITFSLKGGLAIASLVIIFLIVSKLLFGLIPN